MKTKDDCVKSDSGVFYYTKRGCRNGGAGVVYRCRSDKSQDYDFAIKILHEEKPGKTKKERFEKEIEFQKNSDCRYVIKCICSGLLPTGKQYYIMPYCEQTLRDKMNIKSTGFEKIKWFLDVCEGVKYAHANDVIHRDLKPENVLFCNDCFALADFGIAYHGGAHITKKPEKLGNFAYHAPEQEPGTRRSVGFETDIYALGLILNELFTGTIPHGKKSKKIIDVDPCFGYLDPIIYKMLINDQSQREHDIQHIINMIRYHTEKIKNDFEEWVECNDVPEHISCNESEKHDILWKIYGDITLANHLINDDSTDWELINPNYHMNHGYSANLLYNAIMLVKTRQRIEDKIFYESHSCLTGPTEYYTPMNYLGEDKHIFDEFISILDKTVKLNSKSPLAGLKGYCIKQFVSLCNYHGSEVIDFMKRDSEILIENLNDAPLLWFSSYYIKEIAIIKELYGGFDISQWIEINWDRYNSVIRSDSLYSDLPEEKIKIDKVELKLKQTYHNLTIERTHAGFDIYFEKDEWIKFKSLCMSKKDATFPDEYPFEGDVLDMCNKGFESDKYVLMSPSSFDVCNVLYRILFEL